MFLKTLHICYLCCIELCQIVCDPCEIRFMLLRSRSRTLHIYSCWLLHWKLRKNMSSVHTKMFHPFNMTLYPLCKKKGYELGKRKKKLKVCVLKKSMRKRRRKRKKNSSCPKVELEEKSYAREMEITSTKFHAHAHLDLIVWLDFSAGSSFWLSKICNASMLSFHVLPELQKKPY